MSVKNSREEILKLRAEPRYHMKKRAKGSSQIIICPHCHACYFKKLWHKNCSLYKKINGFDKVKSSLCPTCRKIKDKVIEGQLVLSGSYLKAHQEEILNQIYNLEEKSKQRNPLNVIEAVEEGPDKITIYTAQNNLAKSLGKAIYQSHKGKLKIHFSHREKFVYLHWHRDK